MSNSRFVNLFNRLQAINTAQTLDMQPERQRQPFQYVTRDVAMQFDFTNKLIPIPKKGEIQPFLETWERNDSDKLCLVLVQFKDSTLFEWNLYEIFKSHGLEINQIVSERCKYTLAMGGKTIIKPPDMDNCMSVLNILYSLQEKAHQFDIARLNVNIDFPESYSMFAIEYSLSLAKVNSFYLPFEPRMHLFVKPYYNVQFTLFLVSGYNLGEQENFDRDLFYTWNAQESYYILYQPNGESVSVNKAGKVAQDYHKYQSYYLQQLLADFQVPQRPYLIEANNTPESSRMLQLMRKLTCWTDKWLYYDYQFLNKFMKKEQYRIFKTSSASSHRANNYPRNRYPHNSRDNRDTRRRV